jgi:hypothetical protein
MRVCHLGVSLLGLLAILASHARPGWTVAAVIALGVAHAVTARRMGRGATRGNLMLQGDGGAMLATAGERSQVRQHGGAWASRWFCVLPLEQLHGGQRVHCVVCRSLNDPDAYRRLLVRLRMGGEPGPARGMDWL